MSSVRKVLAGFDSGFGINFIQLFSEVEFKVTEVKTLDDMITAMGITPEDSSETSPTIFYDLYIMDTNFGAGRKGTCIPAEKIFRHIESDYFDGRVDFMSFTGDTLARKKAEEKEIPVIGYIECNKQVEFFEKLYRQGNVQLTTTNPF